MLPIEENKKEKNSTLDDERTAEFAPSEKKKKKTKAHKQGECRVRLGSLPITEIPLISMRM